MYSIVYTATRGIWALGAAKALRLGAACESAAHDVLANLGEINEAPRRSAPKPHADLQSARGRAISFLIWTVL